MAEYIEREEIIGELDELISNISFTSPYVDEIDRMIEGMERARDCVYNAETADVVPVVRCKDCQNTCDGWDGLICTSWGFYTVPDGWCYKGERKDGDTNG